MNVAERPAQAVLVGRNRDDMHVIGHQTVRPYRHPGALRRIRQQVEVECIVATLLERPLAPVAVLLYMMGAIGENKSREAGHVSRLNA